MALKIAKINIKNVLGVTDLEITPDGNIIEVSGRNGQGKTSVMEAVKDALGVSDYSVLLRNGEKKGQTILDLDGMVVTKSYTEKGDTTKLEARIEGVDAMSNIGKPASVIKSLINPNSIDPVRLLTAKNKDLLDAVVGAIPLKVDSKVLDAIIDQGNPYDIDSHALYVLAKQTARIMDERKLINRDGKTAQVTADQLQTTLPDDIPVTQELQDQIDSNLEAIENTRTASRQAGRTARQSYDEQAEVLNSELSELDQSVTSLRQQLQVAEQNKALKEAERDTMLINRTKASEAAMELELDKGTEYQEHNAELSKEIAGLKVFENTQKMIKDWMNKVSISNKRSDDLTKQLKQIEAYKSDLCSDLPIKGLAITDGKLSMNGIPFQTLNTAARVDLVLELAKLSAGKLKIVILDNSEMLDKDTYKEFLAKAAKTDLTFLIGRVENHDLEIK